MKGKTVCYHHGGRTPRGIALPQTKTGRYSKDLPTRLAARYQEAVTDPDLLHLDHEIAVLDSRVGEMIAALDGSGATETWRALEKSLRACMAELQAENVAGATETLQQMGEIIENGGDESARWEEIFDLFERRRRLVETQRKTVVDMQQMITAERSMLMVGALVGIIREHVTDRSILAAIASDINRIMVADAGREADSGD